MQLSTDHIKNESFSYFLMLECNLSRHMGNSMYCFESQLICTWNYVYSYKAIQCVLSTDIFKKVWVSAAKKIVHVFLFETGIKSVINRDGTACRNNNHFECPTTLNSPWNEHSKQTDGQTDATKLIISPASRSIKSMIKNPWHPSMSWILGMIEVTQDSYSVLKVYFLLVKLEVKVLSRNIHENNGGQTVKHTCIIRRTDNDNFLRLISIFSRLTCNSRCYFDSWFTWNVSYESFINTFTSEWENSKKKTTIYVWSID